MTLLSSGVSCTDAVDEVRRTLERAEDVRQREVLEFLYAYMPLGDIADYSGSCGLKG